MHTCRFLVKILNKDILGIRLFEYWEKNNPGNTWVTSGLTDKAYSLTFADIENHELLFPSNCGVLPFKRVLCFHATVVNGKAARTNFEQISFKQYWSETDDQGIQFTYLEPLKTRVEAWLMSQS